jgi:hypothetical protein
MKLLFEILPWIIAASAWVANYFNWRRIGYWKSEYIRVAKKYNEFIDLAEKLDRKLKFDLLFTMIFFALWGATMHHLYLKFRATRIK